MTKFDYSNDMLAKNDIIMIDTSSIMDYESLSQLVVSVKPTLLTLGKKIIVPKVVWMELMRHRHSNNLEKQIRVNNAINIIESNLDVFTLDNQDMNNEDIFSAFADAELLSELTKNKPKHTQLLITNDKRLSSDAFKLNRQESCYGGYISVCYVTNEGNLNKCKVVTESYRQAPEIKEKIVEVPVEVPVYKNAQPTESKTNPWPTIGATITALGVGYTIGKYHIQITNAIKTSLQEVTRYATKQYC